MSQLSSIRFKTFSGFALIMLTFSSVLAYMNFALQRNGAGNTTLNHISQLEFAAGAIARRSANYKQNAPRDYASYFRDVEVFHRDFLGEIDTIDGLIKQLGQDYKQASLPAVISWLPNSKLDPALRSDIDELNDTWRRFQAGFNEKMGPNRAEPRIEWGVEYIANDPEGLFPAVRQLSDAFRQLIADQEKSLSQFAYIAMMIALAIALFTMIWFHRTVVRRVATISSACERVSEGDFGHQISAHGSDEISALAHSFNSLSSRTRLVLSIISELQNSADIEQALRTLMMESSGYIGASWMGMVQLNANNRLQLTDMSPAEADSVLYKEQDSTQRSFLSSCWQQGTPILINDLSEILLQTGARGLLRALKRHQNIGSLMGVRLQAADGWTGIVLFASERSEVFTEEQSLLLGNLSEILAESLHPLMTIRNAA